MIRGLALFIGFFLIWLIVLMPLKLVAVMAGGLAGFTYSDVYGSVWDGRVHRARAAGQEIRMVEMSVQPLALLRGALAVDVSASDPAVRGNGRIERGLDGRLQASDADLVVQLGWLGLSGWPGIDPTERVYIRITELTWSDGACQSARGDVRTGALIGFAGRFGFEGPPLDGRLECRDDALMISLNGQSADLEVSGEITLTEQDYAWRVSVETPRSELADALALAGFESEGTAWRAEGRDAHVR